MKELDLLKKDWKKSENAFEQITEKEIYKMIHQKSSSIVKWILIISIIEVLFWTTSSFFINTDEYTKQINHPEINVYLQLFDVFNYSIILIFIYLFYKNYTTISTTASTKLLMSSILKTRKVVQLYVAYNLVMLVIAAIMGIFIAFIYNPAMSDFNEKFASSTSVAFLTIGILLLVILGLLALLWCIYHLIYGRLLRRLLTNYKELKKIDL